jgi:hypothetical protein
MERILMDFWGKALVVLKEILRGEMEELTGGWRKCNGL